VELTIEILSWIGTFVFGLSGGLTAARRQMDLFGFVVIAMVTGTGGGTLRDLLLGVGPVSWVQEPRFLVVSAVAGVIAFFANPLLQKLDVPRRGALVWADAVGLSVFAVSGTTIAMAYDLPAISVVILGMLTAVGGGVIRDLLSDTIPLILHRELYATAAVAGSVAVLVLDRLGAEPVTATIVATGVAFIVRAYGILTGWSLPQYRSSDLDAGIRP
jgi:uncharacterized membrane protein YeiH